jgi:hypothetical protein
MTTDASAARALRWKAKNYTEGLPDDIGPFRELLENYSNIPPEKVDEHLYSIAGIPYPSFLTQKPHTDFLRSATKAGLSTPTRASGAGPSPI